MRDRVLWNNAMCPKPGKINPKTGFVKEPANDITFLSSGTAAVVPAEKINKESKILLAQYTL